MVVSHQQSREGKGTLVERATRVLTQDIPALAPCDVLNPLRIPTTDARAEQVMWDALGRSPEQKQGKKISSGIHEAHGEIDRSMRGVAKTIWRLATFSFELSPKLTIASFTLGCFASLQGLATGTLVSWIQGASGVSQAGMFGLAAAGVGMSAVIFLTSSLTQFNNERFHWVSGIFLAKKLDRALMAQKFKDLDTEELHAAIAEVKQHQMRVNGLLYGLSSGVAGLVGVGLSYLTMSQHYPVLATATVLAAIPRFVVDYFLAPHVDEREREQAARFKKIEAAGKLLSDTDSARELMMHHREEWGKARRDMLLDASRLGRFNIHKDTFWRQMFGSSTLIVTGMVATAFSILDFISGTLSAQALPKAIGAGISLATSAFLVSSFWGQMLTNRIFIQRVLNFFDNGEKAARESEAAPRAARHEIADPLYTFARDSSIRFENIRVTVPGRADPILEFDELVLKPGEVVGIVGERGQGKSTLLKLLMRQMDPTAGTISLHNVRGREGEMIERVDITDCDTREWHSVISKLYQNYPDMEGLTVAQAAHLGTQSHGSDDFTRLEGIVKLREHILSGKPAAEATVIGGAEGGVNFSGGERQGIAVLRSLIFGVRKPIMLLDEPGASSDPGNEQEMLHRIKQLARDPESLKLMVIVSHRYGTLTDADRIVVINNHTIEDIGSHKQLLQRSGTYFKAWKKQTESLLPGCEVDVDTNGTLVIREKGDVRRGASAGGTSAQIRDLV